MEENLKAVLVSENNTDGDQMEITVGGYGILWGWRDAQGTYFAKDTDFWLDRDIVKNFPVFFEHGFDEMFGHRQIGIIPKSTLRPDDKGIWVEMKLREHREYLEMIKELLRRGVLGMSSGAIGHLTKIDDKDGRMIEYPIVEFSLTHRPAEFRTLGVKELKALSDALSDACPSIKAFIPQDDLSESSGNADAGAAAVCEEKQETTTAGGQKMTDTQVTVQPFDTDAFVKAVADEVAKRFPQTPSHGVAVPGEKIADGSSDELTLGNFMKAVARNDYKYLSRHNVKALASDAGSTGGFLIPAMLVNEIFKVAEEQSIVLSRASRYAVAGPVNIPALKIASGGAGKAAWFGGVQMFWHEEGATLSETEPAFEMITLHDHGLGALTYVSNRLLSRSSNLDSELRDNLGRALAWELDNQFINGNGIAKPQGILNSNAALTVTRGTANDFKVDDALKMYSRLLPGSQNAVWLMNPTVLPKLATHTIGNSPLWTPGQNLYFGKPVIFTEKLPALGTAGDVMLADFSYYAVAMPDEAELAVSTEYRFANDQTTYRVGVWVDGDSMLKAPVMLADGSTQVSAFVKLQ